MGSSERYQGIKKPDSEQIKLKMTCFDKHKNEIGAPTFISLVCAYMKDSSTKPDLLLVFIN